MHTEQGFVDIKATARAKRNLTPIVAGQAISLLGDYIAFLTLPLLVVARTDSPLALGQVAAAQIVPVLLFGFAAGVVLDRVRLRPTLISADLVRAAAFALLGLAVHTGAESLAMVIMVAFVVGSMSVLFDSGLQALLPTALPKELLVTANSRLQLAQTLAITLGPAAGGMLVSFGGGFAVAFYVNAATFFVSALFLTRLRSLRAKRTSPRAKFVQELQAGLRFLWSERRLRSATIGAFAVNLTFAPLEALLVLLVTERIAGMFEWPGWLQTVFRAEAEVGVFFALVALIASVGVALAPKVARRLPLGRMFVVGVLLLGAGFIAVGFATSFWAVVPAGIAMSGVAWVNVAFLTMRLKLTPDSLLGRVVAASRTVSFAGLPAGAIVGAAIAERVGLTPVYVGGSVLVILIAIAMAFTPLWGMPLERDVEEVVDSDPRPAPDNSTVVVHEPLPRHKRQKVSGSID